MKKIYESPSVEISSFAVEAIMSGRVGRVGNALSVATWGFVDGTAEGMDQIID